MYVGAHHHISDPDTFWSTVREGTSNLPDGLAIHHCLPSPSGSEAFCLWEGSSVEEVRDFVDSAVGSVSRNEFFEAEAKEGVNLPSGVA